MDRNKLIKLLSQMIEQLCDREEGTFNFEDGEIKLRQYPKLDKNADKLHVLDVIIRF